MAVRPLTERAAYLDKLLAFRDTDLVKVVTGVRRCGKSSLLQLAEERLRNESVASSAFLNINLESRTTNIQTGKDLYDYAMKFKA
jgi:hypothetical protein